MPKTRTGRRAAIATAVLGVAVAAAAALSFSGEITDRLYLWRNFGRLSSSAEATYDPWSGEFRAEYASGSELRRDVLFPGGPVPAKHLTWGTPLVPQCNFAFSGNTDGFFLFPIPFRETCALEFFLEVPLMRSDGRVSAVIMSSPDGQDRLAASFATLELWREGKRTRQWPAQEPRFQQPPTSWIRGAGDVRLRVERSPEPGGEDSRVRIWYDTEGENVLVNSSVLPGARGFAGFSWYMAKFIVRRVSIRGTLDRPAAVKLLHEKAGGRGF